VIQLRTRNRLAHHTRHLALSGSKLPGGLLTSLGATHLLVPLPVYFRLAGQPLPPGGTTPSTRRLATRPALPGAIPITQVLLVFGILDRS